MNKLICISKSNLEQQPNLKQQLLSFTEQITELDHEYAFLPMPGAESMFFQLLEKHSVDWKEEQPSSH